MEVTYTEPTVTEAELNAAIYKAVGDIQALASILEQVTMAITPLYDSTMNQLQVQASASGQWDYTYAAELQSEITLVRAQVYSAITALLSLSQSLQNSLIAINSNPTPEETQA